MQEGAVGYQQYPDANNDFLTGKYAMVMMGTWYTQYSTEKAMTAALKAAGVSGAKPFPIVPIQFPDVAQAGNTGEMFGDADYGLAVSTKAKDKAAAETFVTWLTTSKAGQQAVADQLNDVPALKGVEPNFEQIKFVDPALQAAPVKDLLAKVATVEQPRFALLSQDVTRTHSSRRRRRWPPARRPPRRQRTRCRRRPRRRPSSGSGSSRSDKGCGDG